MVHYTESQLVLSLEESRGVMRVLSSIVYSRLPNGLVIFPEPNSMTASEEHCYVSN